VDVDDVALFLAEFESGVLGTFTASRHSLFRKNQLAFELDASRGALRFTWDKRDELQVGLLDDPEPIGGFRAISLGPGHPDPWWPIAGMGTGYLETSTIQVHKFLDAILTGAPLRPTFRDATHVQRVVDAVLQSHQSGAWVEIEPVSEAVGKL